MGERAWPNLLVALLRGQELSTDDTAWAMNEIMSGSATNAQIAAFLTALRMKGETVEELIGFAQVMRQKVVRIRTRRSEGERRPPQNPHSNGQPSWAIRLSARTPSTE